MRVKHVPDRGRSYSDSDSNGGDTIADQIAIVAQKYAGYFTGNDYRFDQQAAYVISKDPNLKGIHIGKKWKEPVVMSDDCDFCQRLTDAEAVRRVAGFQHQIDIEIIRGKSGHYSNWLRSGSPDVVEFQEVTEKVRLHPEATTAPFEYVEMRRTVGKQDSEANRRRFIELFQNVPRTTANGRERPDGWQHKAMPMVDLPLRLKRKLCVEWNHVYRDYLIKHPKVYYDFETKDFYKEVDPPEPCTGCGNEGGYDGYGNVFYIHTPECKKPDTDENPLNDMHAWMQEFLSGGIQE